MKFYSIDAVFESPQAEVDEYGEWATRTDAEQAAKDAVEMAMIVKEESSRLWAQHKAQAIIERYEGGQP